MEASALLLNREVVMLNLFQHPLRRHAERVQKWTLNEFRATGIQLKKVGSFCCPVLPEPLESPSVARWGPTAL